MIRAVPHVAAMAPYPLATLNVPDGQELISLSQNESLRPPSPLAITAAAHAATQTHLYPDPDCTALRAGLAAHHGLDMDTILCGAGSLDLIGCIARAFAGPQAAVLAPAHAYPFFRSAAQMAQARFDTSPERDGTVDVDALLEAVRGDTRLVCIANPGNPTGTHIPQSEIKRLRAGLREDILLVVDEAYGEFADHLNAPSFDMLAQGNTVVLRTFSKAYGLAGFRVGWGAFPPDVLRDVRKVMNPNAISAPAQAAALAAVQDHAYMRDTCALTADVRDAAITQLRAGGFNVPDSHTNFVLIPFNTPNDAANADAALQSHGIVLRAQSGAGLPHALRMTLAPSHQMAQACRHLNHWKQEQSL